MKRAWIIAFALGFYMCWVAYLFIARPLYMWSNNQTSLCKQNKMWNIFITHPGISDLKHSQILVLTLWRRGGYIGENIDKTIFLQQRNLFIPQMERWWFDDYPYSFKVNITCSYLMCFWWIMNIQMQFRTFLFQHNKEQKGWCSYIVKMCENMEKSITNNTFKFKDQGLTINSFLSMCCSKALKTKFKEIMLWKWSISATTSKFSLSCASNNARDMPKLKISIIK